MSTAHPDGRVAGERVDDLVRLLTQIQPCPPDPDGSYRLRFELLLHDADLVHAGQIEPRTPGQRRADAFVALALRVQDAMSG